VTSSGAAERWRRVEKILDEALDGAAHPGAASVDRPADAGAEADRLLAFCPRLGGFLETPAVELASALIPEHDPPDDHPDPRPSRIGPYRIVQEAGRGGMATVYLAEREDPELRQRVAIKVIRGGVAGAALVRRFIRERQILASLEHPGVARLLDGGVSVEGVPWFAMEYVEGVPITRYCDERRCGIDARLALFVRVCDVVQYAHGKLVVHRDLKPSNIFVTEPAFAGSPGQVKLLDFGVATLLATEPRTDETPTHAALLPLTPEYASPEQLRGEPVSAASDVYQLGVVLYELLTARRPHPGTGLPLHELQRRVLESAPEPPSSVVTRSSRAEARREDAPEDFLQAAARARGTRPDRLRRRLSGDLDTICLTALRAEPARRYASVEQLAEDVRRHLRREPIRARPDTPLYRWSRFARRHGVGVAAASLVFSLLTAFAGAMTVQANRTRRERDRAELATAFLVDLFGAFEPIEARGATVLVPDVLKRGAERARVELADQPLLRARVLEVIAEGFQLQGLHSDAEPLFEEVVRVRAAALGAGHLDVARSRVRLADLRYERGRYDTQALYAEALDSFRRRLGDEAPELVRAEIGLALVLRARGRYAEADSLLRESLRVARTRADMSLDVPIALSFLGKLRTREGDFGEAERMLAEALTLRLELLGGVHPAVANVLDALGELELARGDPVSAEVRFEDALAIRAELYEETHTDVASGLTYLARVRLETGDPVAADTLLRTALPIFRRAFGEESADVAEVLERLGDARAALGDLAAADSLYGRAQDIWRRESVEPWQDRVAALLVRTGALRLRQGKPEAARSLLSEGLALRRRSLPGGHWEIAEATLELGAALSALGRFAEAEPLLLEGVHDLRRSRGEDDRLTQRGLRLLEEHRGRSQRPEGARERGAPRSLEPAEIRRRERARRRRERLRRSSRLAGSERRSRIHR
jgi:serine/threonine-protein kinase